jgi:hypothetical protein
MKKSSRNQIGASSTIGPAIREGSNPFRCENFNIQLRHLLVTAKAQSIVLVKFRIAVAIRAPWRYAQPSILVPKQERDFTQTRKLYSDTQSEALAMPI